ncbi:hypothetical protein [Teichococcus aestuarii]|uniref:hypothetical protein n=1 Tax=Teichococcus aestuarii TaxID=568898 RepID=UPI00362075C5
MSGGFPVDLILFAMVAAFLVLRLRSVLGRRQGFERPPQERPVPGQGMPGPAESDAPQMPPPPVAGAPRRRSRMRARPSGRRCSASGRPMPASTRPPSWPGRRAPSA